MKRIEVTPKFKKRLREKAEQDPSLINKYREMLKGFPQNREQYNDHALKGNLSSFRSLSLGYDLRILYQETHNAFILQDIGTHDEVYK